jgi:hypothetical protein
MTEIKYERILFDGIYAPIKKVKAGTKRGGMVLFSHLPPGAIKKIGLGLQNNHYYSQLMMIFYPE